MVNWKNIAGNPAILGASLIQASQFYVFGAVEFFLVGYLKNVALLDPFQIGLILGSQIIAVILFKPIMGRLSDKIGRTTPIIAGSLLGGTPLIIIPLSTHFSILLFLSIMYGFGFAMVTSSTPAIVSEIAPQNLTGTAMGFLSMTMDIGQTIGPLITGMLLATNLGFQGTFPLLTAVLILSVLLFMSLKGSKKLVVT